MGLHLHDGLLAVMMRNGFPFGSPGLERTFHFFSFVPDSYGIECDPLFPRTVPVRAGFFRQTSRSPFPDDADGVHVASSDLI